MNSPKTYLGVALIIYMGLSPAGQALQVLEAADHAELEAEIAADAVNRIALENDRVLRVVQAPGGLRVEHDPVRGDVYLYPDGRIAADGATVVLYLGTERGRTYRLSLAVTDRDSAQILIRNTAVEGGEGDGGPEAGPYAEELVELIRAVARATPLPGYSIAPAGGSPVGGGTAGPVRSPEGDNAMNRVRVLEVWRGPRWTARILRVPKEGSEDAAAVAARLGGRVRAAWVSEQERGPSGGRLALIVEANGSSGTDR